MLDVFGLAGAAIGGINPQTTATIMYSTGFATNADGSTTQQYNTATVQIEVQATESEDLKQLETISQQAIYRTVYVYGVLSAINRPLQTGGDMLQFYGAKWLVTKQIEEWGNGDWSKVIVAQQLNA